MNHAYTCSTPKSRTFSLEVLTDAAMSRKKYPYARGCYIVYRCFGDMLHPIHWQSQKLRREARSSGNAEILAGCDAHDIGLYLKALLE